MKSFKTLFILGCLAVTFIIGMIVGNAIVSDTVDFNGKIVSISESDDGTYTLKAESVFGGEFEFVIDGRSKLENSDGKRIYIEEIDVGDNVLIDLRNPLFSESDVKRVNGLMNFASSESQNGD